MSRRVTVNFEALAIEHDIECQFVLESLERIDKMIEELDRLGAEIGEAKVKDYKEYLLASKEKIRKKVQKARTPFEENKGLKTQTFDSDVGYGGKRSREIAAIYEKLKNVRYDLRQNLAEYVGTDIELIQAMLENGIYNDGLEKIAKMLEKRPGM